MTVYDDKGGRRGADLLLPEGGYRHLERVRRPPTARRSRRTAAATGCRSTTITFPPNGSARRPSPAAPIAINIPASTNAAGAVTRADSPASALDVSQRDAIRLGFGVTNLAQDGYAPGQLDSVSVESNGIVMARYSNGQSRPAGQIEIATLPQPAGPAAAGRQRLGAHASPRATRCVGAPGNGNLGVLQAGALEERNVDLTAELVEHDHRAARLPGQRADDQDESTRSCRRSVNLR